MIQTIRAKRNKSVLKALSFFVAVTFITSSVLPSVALASQLPLPAPTQFVPLSENYSFPVLKGLKFDQSNPFRIEFIIDTSNQKKVSEEEASQLIRYFLAGLTIPGKDIWVNLSPYEKGRIVDESLGQTDLGKDLLSQDYILKQLSSSLTYPESEIGKSYWTQIYTKVASIANTTKLPINTFNKIWITPDKAEVYEDKNMALVTQAKLKTMLEEDYLALQNNTQKIQAQGSARNLKDGMMDQINKVSSGVMRDFILPKINEEVNSGKNFATLRQIHYSLILAIWFKQKFQDSIYKNYINQAKVKGIDLNDSKAKEEIYDRYVEAFQKGVYNYIKQDVEPNTNKKIKRQYVSGGYDEGIKVDVNGVEHAAWLATTNKLSVSSPAETFSGSAAEVTIDIEGINAAGKAVAISSPVQDDAAGRAKELDFLVRDGNDRIFGLRKHIENLQEDVLRLNRGPGGSKPGAEENSLIADSMKQIELNHKEIAKIEQDIKSWIAELQPLESALKAATEGKKDASSPVTAKELYDEATSGLSSKTVASNTAAHIVEKTASDIVQKFGASRKFTEKELKDYLEPIGNAPLSNFLMKAYTVLSEKAKTSSPVTVKDEKKIKTLEENIAWGERRIEELNVENTSLEDHIKEYRATSATLGSMAGDLIKEAKGQIENNNVAILRLKHNIFVYERELEILKGEEGKVSSPVGEESFRLQVARHKSSQGEISAASPVTADSSSELSLPEWLIVINVAVKERKLNLSDEIRQIEKNVWDALKDGVENKKLNLSSYLKDRDAFYSFLNQKGGIFEMAERGFSTLVVNRSLMSDGIYGWIQQALGQLTKQESDSADGLRFWFLSALRDDTKIRKIKVDAIKDYLSKAEELKNNLQDHNYWGQGFFDLFDNEGISWRASCFAYALAILSLSDDVTYRDGARWIINNKLGHDLKNSPERFYNYVAGILNDMAKEEALKYTDVFKKAVSSSPVENEVIDFLNSLDPQKIMVIRTAGARAVGDGRGIDYKEMKGRHTFFVRPDVADNAILNEVFRVLSFKGFDKKILVKIEKKAGEVKTVSSPGRKFESSYLRLLDPEDLLLSSIEKGKYVKNIVTNTGAFRSLGRKTADPANFVGWKTWPFFMMQELKKQGLFEVAKALNGRIRQGEINDLVFIGIGGSAAPLEAELDLLYGSAWRTQSVNGARIHIWDTTDKEKLNEVLNKVDLKHTAPVVISKSGGTLEPDVDFRVLKQRMIDAHGADFYKYIYVVTDKAKGALRAEADKEGYTVAGLVPDDIGGRFSIFTAVGMFVLATLGNDISDIAAGAKSFEDYEKSTYAPENNNVALTLARVIVANNKKFGGDTVFWAYGKDRWLGEKTLAEQLNDESINEEGKGPSAFLMLCDGKERGVEKTLLKRKDVHVHIVVDEFLENDPALKKEFEERAARLKEKGLAQVVLHLPKMNEFYLGYFMQLMHNTTGYAGEFLLDDPSLTYTQSGVEFMKVFVKALLGGGADEKTQKELKDYFDNPRWAYGKLDGTNLRAIVKGLGYSLPTLTGGESEKIYLDLTNLLLTNVDRDAIYEKAHELKSLLNMPDVQQYAQKVDSDIEKALLLAAANIVTGKKNNNFWVYSNSLSKNLADGNFADFAADNDFPSVIRVTEAPQGQHSVQNGVLLGENKWFNTIVVVDKHEGDLSVPSVKEDYLKGQDFDVILNSEALATSLAMTKKGRPNVLVMVKDKKGEAYLLNFLKLAVVLAGKGSASSSPVENKVMKEKELWNKIADLEERSKKLSLQIITLSGQGNWKAAEIARKEQEKIEKVLISDLMKELELLQDGDSKTESSSSPVMVKIPLSEESRKLQDTSHKLGQGQTNSDAGSESSPVKALDQKSYAELKQLQTKIGDELALLRFHGPNDDYGRPRRGYAEKIAKLTRSLSRVNDAFKKAREARQTQRTPDIDLDEVSSSPAGDNDQRQNELIGQITKLEEEKAGLNSRMARLSGQGDWRAAKAPNRRLHEIETKLLPGLYKQLFDLDDQEAGSQAGSSPVEMWKLSSSELLGVVGAAIRETGNAVEFYGKGEWSLRSSDKGKREKMIGSLKQIQDALSILFRKIQNEKVVIKAYSEPDFIRTLKGLKLFGGHDEDNLQYGALNLRLKETYEGMLKPGFKSLKGAKTANDKNLSVAKNIKKVQVAGSSGLVNAWEMKDAELVDLAYKAIEMIEKDMVRRQDDKKALYSEVDWLFGRRADLVNFINTIDEYHLPEFAKNEKGFKRFFGYLFKDGDIPELKHSAYFYLQMAQSGREKDSIVVSSLVKEVGSSSPVSEESRKLQGTSHTRANMINEMEKVKIAVKSVKVVSEKLISGENDIEGQTGELTKVFDLDNGKYSLKVIMHLVGENGHLRLKIYYLLLTEKQKTGDKINADITFNPDKDIQTYRNVYAHDDENEGVRYLLNTAIVKLLVDSAEQGDWDAAYSLIEAADKGDLIAQDAIKNLNPGHLEVSNPDRNESYILLQELEGRGNLLAKSRADRMQERDSKRQASSSPAGGIVDSASSFDDTQGRLTIDSAGKSHYGGIDMNGIKVAASVNSTPANMPIIDLKDFAGLTFRIVKLEEIKDIRLALNLAPADAPAAKGEEMRLAMAK